MNQPTNSGPDILNIVHQSAKKGTLLASCEPEVKELMHQIDILLSSKENTSNIQLESLKATLKQRERDLSSLRVTIQEKTLQVEKLREELLHSQHQLKVKSSDHETQLLRLRSELTRLNKSYEKLKVRKLKSFESTGQQSLEKDCKALRETLGVLQRQNDSQQEEIKQLRQSYDTSRSDNTRLQEKISVLQKDLEMKVCELEQSKLLITEKETALEQCEQQLLKYQETLKSKEKRLMSLKTERDESRQQTKSTLMESQKWYSQLQNMSQQNKEQETNMSALLSEVAQLQNSLEICLKEKSEYTEQVSALQELADKKDQIIKGLEHQYTQKFHSEVSRLQDQIQSLQTSLKTMADNELKLREDNSKLKKKLEGRQTKTRHTSLPVQNDFKIELDKRESEVNSYRAQLLKKETMLHTLQDRISHLEDQLSEATLQLNLSGSQPNRVNDMVGGASPGGNDTTATRFKTGLAGLKVATPPTTPNKATLLERFQQQLDSVMDDHFSRMDQSLQKALTEQQL